MHPSDESSIFAPLSERWAVIRWLKRIVPNPRLSFRSRKCRQQFAAFIQRTANSTGATVLNIGSKSVDLGPNVLNLDIRPYPGIHVNGDGHRLPFKDEAIDGVIIAAVLEHVADPSSVVHEIERVLRANGEVYVEVPFMRPFHPDPEDYQRYSLTGLEELFKHFAIVEKGMGVGPSSGLASILSQYVAILLCFKSHKLYKVLGRLCRILFVPLTFLDMFLQRIPYSLALAGSCFLIGVKRTDESPPAP
jgi:SAM-dependent methyltransferase